MALNSGKSDTNVRKAVNNLGIQKLAWLLVEGVCYLAKGGTI